MIRMSSSAAAGPHPTIEEHLGGHVRAGDWPGASYLVGDTDGGVRFRGAVGKLSVAAGDALASTDSLYDCASLTKPLVLGATLLALSARGAVDLERPLDRELPEWHVARGSSPSFADLLAHRSGVRAWFPLYRATADPAAVVSVVAGLPPAGPPGKSVVYSCLGAIAASVALERLIGDPLDVLFEHEVASQLDLPRRDFWLGRVAESEEPRTAPTEQGRHREAVLAEAELPSSRLGFDRVPGSERFLRGEVHDGNASFIGARSGNAGLFATSGVVHAIACALASGKRPFDASMVRRVSTVIGEAGGEARTFGFQSGASANSPAGSMGAHSFGHAGFTGTSVWIDPVRDIVAVLLTNRVHPAWRDAPMHQWRREFHACVLEALGLARP